MAKGIHTRTELLALANLQKREGKSDLAEFVINRGPKVVEETLQAAWEMQKAPEELERGKKSRLEILEETLKCICSLWVFRMYV